MTKILAIVNNKGRQAEKNARPKAAIDRMKNELGADIVFTDHHGHAEKIAGDSTSYDTLIAAGGDGTVYEVVNGMNLDTQALAVMPFGSGNSFAWDRGMTSPEKTFEAVKRDKRSKVDIIDCRFKANGKLLERYNVATSGLGFASATVHFANRRLKTTKASCYSLSACLKAFNQETLSAKVQTGGLPQEDIKFTNFFVNNTKHAGNTCVFPAADLKDAAFDILFARTNALTQSFWNIGIFTKTYFYYPGHRSANKLRVTLDKPSLFMLDGEIFDSVKEIHYSIMPGRLSVLT